jgi:acyl carrier protein
MTLPSEHSDVYQKLLPVFRDVFDDDELTVDANTTAQDVDGWDSLAHIRLVVSVEKAFAIKFSAAEIDDLANVGDFVALIRSKL